MSSISIQWLPTEPEEAQITLYHSIPIKNTTQNSDKHLRTPIGTFEWILRSDLVFRYTLWMKGEKETG